MKLHGLFGALALCGLIVAGCSKKDSASRSSGGQNASSDLPTSKQYAEAAANLKKAAPLVGAEMGNAMQAMSKVVAQSENVTITPVDFHALKDMLPESVGDFKRKSMEGQKQMGMSEATGDYGDEKGDVSFTIKITDPGNMRAMLAGGAAMAFSMDLDKETDSGYERNVKFEGFLAHEKMEGTSGEMTVLVGDRFMIEVQGSNIKADQMKAALGALPLKKLEGMKDEGVEKAAPAAK
jgi:hypothetical protein